MQEKLPYRLFIIFFWSFWLLWIFIHFYIATDFYSSPFYALYDSLVSNSGLILISLALYNTLRYYGPNWKIALFLVFLIVLAALLWNLGSLSILSYIEMDNPPQALALRISVSTLLLSIFLLSGRAMKLYQDQQQEKERYKQFGKTLKQTELKQLRQQLQPHFLFNSLNSIYSLSLSHPDQAREMISKLSDFMRNTVRKDSGKLVRLEEEIKQVTLYLDIEKVRFGNRLKIEIDCQEKPLEARIPSLLLQPVVENAIKYGLYGTTGEVIIKLGCRLTGQFLEIAIENPFDMEARGGSNGTGFGLSSLRKRLFLLFNRSDLLITEEKDGTFKTLIRIPQ